MGLFNPGLQCVLLGNVGLNFNSFFDGEMSLDRFNDCLESKLLMYNDRLLMSLYMHLKSNMRSNDSNYAWVSKKIKEARPDGTAWATLCELRNHSVVQGGYSLPLVP